MNHRSTHTHLIVHYTSFVSTVSFRQSYHQREVWLILILTSYHALGVAFLRQCAPKLFFDIISRACEAEDIAICISGDLVPEEPTLSVPNQPSGLQCPVAGAGEILYFPHRYNCNNFYTCERGIAYLRKCSPGEQYDVKSEVCMQSSEAVCLNAL